jgi:hypothetical protein
MDINTLREQLREVRRHVWLADLYIELGRLLEMREEILEITQAAIQLQDMALDNTPVAGGDDNHDL